MRWEYFFKYVRVELSPRAIKYIKGIDMDKVRTAVTVSRVSAPGMGANTSQRRKKREVDE